MAAFGAYVGESIPHSAMIVVEGIAAELAKQQNLPDYGVLVSTEESGGFKVVVTTVSPGHLFTQYVCR